MSQDAGDKRALEFAQLLNWHLKQGTGREAGTDARWAWSDKAFADAIGINERTVRNWRDGSALPRNVAFIERVLFGDNEVKMREELRAAHARSLNTKELRRSAAFSGHSVPPIADPIETAMIGECLRVTRHLIGLDSSNEAARALQSIDSSIYYDSAVRYVHGQHLARRLVGRLSAAAKRLLSEHAHMLVRDERLSQDTRAYLLRILGRDSSLPHTAEDLSTYTAASSDSSPETA